MEYNKAKVQIATGFNISDKHQPSKTHSGFNKKTGAYLNKSK